LSCSTTEASMSKVATTSSWRAVAATPGCSPSKPEAMPLHRRYPKTQQFLSEVPVGELDIAILTLGCAVFATSAGAKLRSGAAFRLFRIALRDTALVPARFLGGVAVLAVTAEGIVAVGLAVAATLTVTAGPGAVAITESALGAATGLAGVLAGGVAIMVHRGTRAPCACFGRRSGRPLGALHVVRNGCLMVVLATGLFVGPGIDGRLALPDVMVAVLGGGIGALLLIMSEDVADLFAPAPREIQAPAYSSVASPVRDRRRG
jgi:methylamine utilization protein MauE